MRMIITTGDLEEGAHHVSEEVYKKVALLIMSETHPEISRPTPRALDECLRCGANLVTESSVHDGSVYCTACGTRQ